MVVALGGSPPVAARPAPGGDSRRARGGAESVPVTAVKRLRSLRALQLAYGLALLLLVAIAAAGGAGGLALRGQWANEAGRIDALRQAAAALRGDLYRQTKELFDRHFFDDPHAEAQYRAYGAAIGANLAALAALARSGAERAALARLEDALARARRISDAIMARPFGTIAEAERLALLDTEFERNSLTAVEEALAGAEEAFFGAERDLQARVNDWTRLAFAVSMAPIAAAAALLFVARGFLQRQFARPLASLLRTMAAYGEGRFDRRETETGAAEMVALQRATNRMAADLARYRAALVRTEKDAALGALVPVIAHNIRNPLAGIRASAQLLDSASARGIVAAVDRLNGWLEALLAYLDPRKAQRAEASLAACADRALAMLAEKFDGKDATVVRRGWARGGMAMLDPRLAEQALYGLIANAAEASPRGGEVTLSVGADEERRWISIEDRGPGLAFAPRPGGPLPGPTTKTRGSGLGIPFAYKVCDLHDGKLEFAARPGGGTRATLTVPAPGRRSAA